MAFYHSSACSCPEGCCDCWIRQVYLDTWRNRLIECWSQDSWKLKKYHVYIGEV